MVTTVSAIFTTANGEFNLNTWLDKITSQYSAQALKLIQQSYLFTQHHCANLQTAYHTSCVAKALETANILLALQVDYESICAALLWPSATYAHISRDAIAEEFGAGIATLIEGVRKMHTVENISNADSRLDGTENFRNMLLTTMDDLRVVLIKLAIQCYAIRNLHRISKAEQQKVVDKTLRVYTPLANRLGVYELKWELEDLAFRYLEAAFYKKIANNLHTTRLARENYVVNLVISMQKLLHTAKVTHKISGRAKHIYSIYKKMQSKKLSYDAIYDQIAIRILVSTVEDCYQALSVVHVQWEHVAEQFADYIAVPKSNGYRATHTIILVDRQPVEIQICTDDMYAFNEMGAAAHWAYKESGINKTAYDKKIAWLKQLLAWQQELAETKASISQLPQPILSNEVFVFTPRGDTISLAQGATPLDFAYHLHSNLGHSCRGAKVNENIVPLTYTLKTGDKIEIFTSPDRKPNRNWLNTYEGYLKTRSARRKVTTWFKQLDYDQHIVAGEVILSKELKRLNLKNVHLAKLADYFHFTTTNHLLAAIGANDLRLTQLVAALTSQTTIANAPATDYKNSIIIPAPVVSKVANSIVVAGVNDLLTRIAGCCRPMPGDAILGYITRGQGISIHKKSCAILRKQQLKKPGHILPVDWPIKSHTGRCTVKLVIKALESPDLVAQLTHITSREKAAILELAVYQDNKRLLTLVNLMVELTSIEKLERLTMHFKNITHVYEVNKV